MKIDVNKVDLTNSNQKVIAAVLLIATLFLLYYVAPPLVLILKNTWTIILLGAPLALIVLFVAFNPMLIWNVFKQLSWNLTKSLISGDKLGYMYRYHDYILMKMGQLDANIKNIGTIRVKLQRRIAELNSSISNNNKQVAAHQRNNSPQTVISVLVNKISLETKQLQTLLPRFESIESQEGYLVKLYEAWDSDQKQLKDTLDLKAQEYEMLKEASEAVGNAKEFLKGNTEEYKIYQESLNQIEQSVSQYTANLDDFERKVRPILDDINAQKAVDQEAGLKLIEEFKKTGSLKLDSSSL